MEPMRALAIDATVGQEYEIPPDPDLLAAIKQGVTAGQLDSVSDNVRGIVQRARGPALFAVRPPGVVLEAAVLHATPSGEAGPAFPAGRVVRLGRTRGAWRHVRSVDGDGWVPAESVEGV